jgi:putative FmdB family regulatory protein
MPLYEYKCQECGLRFERRQSFTEEPVSICPECHGKVMRLIHPAGIIFKGSGFYVTDNRGKSSTAVAGKKKDEDQETKSASTSDNKDTPKSTATESVKSEKPASSKSDS